MARIEVGMLVEIISNDCFEWASGRVGNFVGHIGRVIAQVSSDEDSWFIDGATVDVDGVRQAFYSSCLRPVNPDNKASSWDAQVFQDLGWNPSKLGVE